MAGPYPASGELQVNSPKLSFLSFIACARPGYKPIGSSPDQKFEFAAGFANPNLIQTGAEPVMALPEGFVSNRIKVKLQLPTAASEEVLVNDRVTDHLQLFDFFLKSSRRKGKGRFMPCLVEQR